MNTDKHNDALQRAGAAASRLKSFRPVCWLAGAMLLAGCATTIPRPEKPPATAEWTKGDFHVRFQAGPRGQEDGAASFYKITHAAAGRGEQSIVMESAHSLGGFGSVTNGDPRNWIRLVQESKGRALMIEEEIPNDCGPCSNYLWIHLDSKGLLQGEFLRLPSEVTGPPGGIDHEYPEVKSLDGDFLRFGYSTGADLTERLGRIEKSDRPTPPG
jgi:hypothetical protein